MELGQIELEEVEAQEEEVVVLVQVEAAVELSSIAIMESKEAMAAISITESDLGLSRFVSDFDLFYSAGKNYTDHYHYLEYN